MKRCHYVLLVLFTTLLSFSSEAAYLVKMERHRDAPLEKATVLSVTPYHREESGELKSVTVLRSFPAYLAETPDSPQEKMSTTDSTLMYEEIIFSEVPLWVKRQLPQVQSKRDTSEKLSGTEVRTLVEQGPKTNRINLVMLGDGYTEAEKEKFFSDAQRITNGLFTGNTFASYLPLFNVYAVFVPSIDSGITDLTSKRTAFGLYRNPAGSKRAIMPGNTGAIENALSLAPVRADYPIIIANDDFYGGLGGRYAITTRSVESGLVVLRHELGHNFGEVGEEYDGGQVYQGANSARNLQEKWAHWLTPNARTYDAKLLSGAYVWQNLAKPYTAQFQFPAASVTGPYTFSLLISTVGWKTPEDASAFVDGQKLDLQGKYTEDRSFFEIQLGRSLAPGKHTIEIHQNIADGDNVLAFAELFAHEANYDFSRSTIAGYPSYNNWGMLAGYRPTHDGCIMRNMVIDKFCAVDKENMWIKFFARVRLIDNLTVENTAQRKHITLHSVQLVGNEVRWTHVSPQGKRTALTAFDNSYSVDLSQDTQGTIEANITFNTPEIRMPGVKIADTRNAPL